MTVPNMVSNIQPWPSACMLEFCHTSHTNKCVKMVFCALSCVSKRVSFCKPYSDDLDKCVLILASCFNECYGRQMNMDKGSLMHV